MMCAAHAGSDVLIIDHAKAAGDKIRISGGGRCNFTNMGTGAATFLSSNPHFAKSALKRYTQWDFINLVTSHRISYHEKTLGQLFCDNSAKDIITMLHAEMAGAKLWLKTTVDNISHNGTHYIVHVTSDSISTPSHHQILLWHRVANPSLKWVQLVLAIKLRINLVSTLLHPSPALYR